MYVKFHFDNEYEFIDAVGYLDIEDYHKMNAQNIEDLQQIVAVFDGGGDAYEGLRRVYFGLTNRHRPETDAMLLEFAKNIVTTCPSQSCGRCRSKPPQRN